MKRINYLLRGGLTFAVILLLASCNGKKSTNDVEKDAPRISGSLRIAYVDVDTLLSKYSYAIDLNDMMMKKEENIRATLNEQARDLQQEGAEFQRKVQNNAFVSQDRAQQENARLQKKQQDLQELQNRLTNELQSENQKNSLQLRDSINHFLKEYNKKHHYDMIFSNSGFDNLLYANQSFNITKDIVEGLNSRYKAKKK
jgi:outer membrane protein